MHVYGSLPQPGVLDRWPAPAVPTARIAAREPVAWPMPNITTRVELAPPPVWRAPNPELLMSITIAPLRFVPISWAPPVMVHSPWGPPIDASTTADPSDGVTARRFAPRRVWAVGVAAAAAIGLAAAAIAIF
jgi:hypothetical protein